MFVGCMRSAQHDAGEDASALDAQTARRKVGFVVRMCADAAHHDVLQGQACGFEQVGIGSPKVNVPLFGWE